MIQYTTGAHNHDKEHDNCIIYMCVCIIRYYCVCVRKKIQKELMLKKKSCLFTMGIFIDFLNKRISFLFITPVFFFFFFFF